MASPETNGAKDLVHSSENQNYHDLPTPSNGNKPSTANDTETSGDKTTANHHGTSTTGVNGKSPADDQIMKGMLDDEKDSSDLSDPLDEWQDSPEPKPEPAPRRRSARNRKAPINYEDEYVIPASQPTSAPTAASSRPKRKASSAAQCSFTSKEDLDLVTDTICKPLTSDELVSYKGWVELESDPQFFQAILHEMGAPKLKITELFSTDEGSVGLLPKPVYGLIFLFPYVYAGEDSAEERHECPEGLWFANQTTANACATVALMNITMNIPDHNFGPELKKFKNETAGLSSHNRGDSLTTNDFIRCIHNSVARRTQLLNEDLAWKNKTDEEKKAQRRKGRSIKVLKGRSKAKGKATTPIKKKTTTNAKRKQNNSDVANHYIAFVPHGGKVWELDGLEDKPLCLGPYQGGDDNWTQTAIETIQVRMAAGIFSNTFNLLALCASPLQDLTDRLATTLAAAHKLEAHSRVGGEDSMWPHPPISELYPSEKLLDLNGLTWDMVDNIGPSAAFLEKTTTADFDKEKATLLMTELIVELTDLAAELTEELSSRKGACEAYEARQRDFTPFIHQLLPQLADKGSLGDLVDEFMDS